MLRWTSAKHEYCTLIAWLKTSCMLFTNFTCTSPRCNTNFRGTKRTRRLLDISIHLAETILPHSMTRSMSLRRLGYSVHHGTWDTADKNGKSLSHHQSFDNAMKFLQSGLRRAALPMARSMELGVSHLPLPSPPLPCFGIEHREPGPALPNCASCKFEPLSSESLHSSE
jgi:hypothetical protein